MQVFVIGDSHAAALSQGFLAIRKQPEYAFPHKVKAKKILSSPWTEQAFFSADDGAIRFFREDVRRDVELLTGSEALTADLSDSLFFLSLGYVTTKLLRRKDWLHHVPWNVAGGPSTQPMSDGVFRAVTLNYQTHCLEFYRAMQALGLRCVAVSAPPPRRDDPALEREMDPEVFLTLDKLARETVRAELDRMGIETILPPESVYEQPMRTGFLKPEYHAHRPNDFHHGNDAYGAVMMTHILAAAEEIVARG